MARAARKVNPRTHYAPLPRLRSSAYVELMTDVDLTHQTASAPGGNAEPYSVSELAFALKRTLESAYGFVGS